MQIWMGPSCLSFEAFSASELNSILPFPPFTDVNPSNQFNCLSSLGVHISFVRSIAMDSWTDKQLALMKGGGNQKCNEYLKARGIDARTPIKQKYESDAAQLYKEVLKARVEGRPEPTSIPKKAPASGNSYNRAGSAPMSGGGPAPVGGAGDPNGMERLPGESDSQYVQRQTRLREEARARMAAKFGNSGGSMGGVGSGGRMQGIGSNPGYDPNSGYGNDLGMDSVTSAFGSAFSTIGSAVGTSVNYASKIVNDEQTQAKVVAGAGSFWGSLTSTVSSVANSMTQPDGDDGLDALQREIANNKPMQSKYSGVGSDSNNWGQKPTNPRMASQSSSSMGSMASMGSTSSVSEAPGLPGEDRNGVERLTGETDEQYVARQTRLRDEAKARMAAKFGGGGMGSAASSSSYQPSAPAPAPASGNFPKGMSLGNQAPKSGNGFAVKPSPASGNSFGGAPRSRTNSKDSVSSGDFFENFGA